MPKVYKGRPLTPELLNAMGKKCLPGYLGIEVTLIDDSGLTCRMEVKPELLAPNAYLHAGAVVTLADTACGYGAVTRLPEEARGFTTIELKSNFTGTATTGSLVCYARPLHIGRLTQLWEATVVVENTTKAIAHFRCTQMILFP